VLEPSVGIGNFLRLKPQYLQTQVVAVEQDAITVKIAQNLYPSAHIKQCSFQDVAFADNYFDYFAYFAVMYLLHFYWYIYW